MAKALAAKMKKPEQIVKPECIFMYNMHLDCDVCLVCGCCRP